MTGDELRAHRPLAPLGLPDEKAKAIFARMNAMAARFYCDRLSNSWVPGYLRARGFSPQVQQRWHVGYAPTAWDALTRHLRTRGCPDALIEAAGLARRTQAGGLRDTFRDRAMLPIRSPRGIVVGFIGRAPADAEPRVPKYLNSPRTCLYEKSATLFGLWEGRAALAQGGQPVIVEGPFDAIAVTTASQAHVGLASCGTALTRQHATLIGQRADLDAVGAVLAFDADDAGRRAAVRAYHLLFPFTDRLTMVNLPVGQDPAQALAERGPAFLAALLRSTAQPLADLVIDEDLRRWARWLEYPEGQINALRSAARLISAMPPGQAGRQVARLAARLRLDADLVTGAVTDALAGSPSVPGRSIPGQ